MNIHFHKNIKTSLGNFEVLTAGHTNHHFPKHFHETFPFGVITRGVLGFHYRGEKVKAWQGTINLANPGEIHDGFPLSKSGWQYRMFYIDRKVINTVMNRDAQSDLFPWFNTGVIHDSKLAAKIFQFHQYTESKAPNPLAVETHLFLILEELINKYTFQPSIPDEIHADNKEILRVLQKIRESSYQTSSLKQLAEECGLSVGYFIRAFKKVSGLTPHQYQIACRMERARSQILEMNPLSNVAIENGFVDQSHFQRVFKQFYGYTPGVLQTS